MVPEPNLNLIFGYFCTQKPKTQEENLTFLYQNPTHGTQKPETLGGKPNFFDIQPEPQPKPKFCYPATSLVTSRLIIKVVHMLKNSRDQIMYKWIMAKSELQYWKWIV